MLASFLTILPVFLVVVAGYGAARARVLTQEAGAALSRFVAWIALPCLMFHLAATTDWAAYWDTGFVCASLSGSIAVFAAGMLLGRLRGLRFADVAVDGLNASYANAAYLGLPLLLLAIGPASAPYVLLAATITLMTLFALAVIAVEFAHNRASGSVRVIGKAGMGVIRNPVLAAGLAGAAWWSSGLALPGFIGESTRLLGGTASPVALFSIGVFLAGRSLRASVANRTVVALTAVKLVLHPALTALLVYGPLQLKPFPAMLAVLIAAMPTGTGPFMFAGFYARDGQVTSGTIFLSTLLAPFTLVLLLSVLPR